MHPNLTVHRWHCEASSVNVSMLVANVVATPNPIICATSASQFRVAHPAPVQIRYNLVRFSTGMPATPARAFSRATTMAAARSWPTPPSMFVTTRPWQQSRQPRQLPDDGELEANREVIETLIVTAVR